LSRSLVTGAAGFIGGRLALALRADGVEVTTLVRPGHDARGLEALDSPDIFTLSRAIVSLNSSEVPRQFLMAGAVIVTVPVLVIFLWAERFMVQGLTAGSVKSRAEHHGPGHP